MGDDTKPTDAIGVEGKMWVRSIYKDADGHVTNVTDEQGRIEVRKFLSEPAKVYVGLGMTKSPRQYHSVKVDVGISLPCYPEEKEACFAEAMKWAEEKIAKESASIDAIMKKQTGI
jgi:hypothetical protein